MKAVRFAAHARQGEWRRDALEDLVARGFTRRQVLRIAALVGAGATALPFGGERALAQPRARAIPDRAARSTPSSSGHRGAAAALAAGAAGGTTPVSEPRPRERRPRRSGARARAAGGKLEPGAAPP
jgi:hypothetical protein